MKKSLLTIEQEQLLDREGRALREMMKHEGWTVMAKLFAGTLENYDSTQGLKSLKEMLARQDALAMMNAWMEQVVQRVSRLDHKETVSREVKARIERSGLVTVSEEEEDK